MFTFPRFKKRSTGFTLTEIIVATCILSVVGGIVGHWFFMQRSYQQQILRKSDAQQRIRRASWKMIREIRMARTILSPRLNPDNSICSDDKIFFKNYRGDIICYFHNANDRTIKRCTIPNGPGAPVVDKALLADGIDMAAFTAYDSGNRLIGIFLDADGTFGLESVYLLNE